MCRIKYIIILIIYMFIVSFTFSKSSSETVYIDIAVKKSDSFLVMNKNLDSRTYHLITHGRPGQLLIEGKWLNAEQITDFLKPKIQNSEFKIQNLNIYGCEFAKGEEGINAVKYIESKLDVKVSASTNLTGKDGDWVLEVGVKANFSFLKDYPYTLQTGPNDDLDGDTVLNKDDLDDDNDGILDANELICAESPQTLITFSEATNYSTTYNSGEAFNIGTGTFSTGATGEVFPLAGGTMAGQTRYGFESKPNYIITRARTGATASSPAFVGINFSTPVYNLSFEIDHLNSVFVTGSTPVEKKERVLINATYQGVSVPLASYTLESGVNYNTTNGYFSSNGTDIANSGAVLNFVGPVDQVSFSYSATGRDHTVYENEIHILKNATGCVDGDFDGDGVVNRFDLDSDGDGCPDAVEGDGGITSNQLQTSNINGGNTGAEYNGTAGPVIDNLGNNVGDTGIPTIANGGQAVGTSQNASAINEEECGAVPTACDDLDGDGFCNASDSDDDNDGILDIDEQECTSNGLLLKDYDGVWTNKHGDSYKQYSENTGIRVASYRDTGTESYKFSLSDLNPNVVNTLRFRYYSLNPQNIRSQNVTLKVNGTSLFSYITTKGQPDPPPAYTVDHGYKTVSFTPTSETAEVILEFVAPTSAGGTSDGLFREFNVNGETNLTCTPIDTDNDGLPNHQDLDSDGDGCPDALEGDGGITSGQLQTSNINGGNTGSGYNGIAGPVNQNLGNGVDDEGVPTIANNGQAIGTSQDATTINDDECGTECNQCFIAGVVGGSENCDDFDGDGILNSCDLDDDNDRILDTVEGCITNHITRNWVDEGNGVYTSVDPLTGIATTITLGNYSTFWDNGTNAGNNSRTGCSTCTETGEDLNSGRNMNFGAGNGGGSSSGTFEISFTDASGQPLNIKSPKIHILGMGGSAGSPTKFTSVQLIAQNSLTLTKLCGGIALKNSNELIHSRITDNTNNTRVLSCDSGEENGSFILNDTNSLFTFQVTMLGTAALPSSGIQDAFIFYVEYSYCEEDTDEDGVPNQFDLDSDDDGCPDAFESGATTNKTASKFNTTQGAGNGDENGDGLADIVDNGANGGTANDGVPDYNYIPYAYDKDLNYCTDTDNDGVPDIVDLDDDNDGILDKIECPAAYTNLVDGGGFTTNPPTPNWYYSNSTFNYETSSGNFPFYYSGTQKNSTLTTGLFAEIEGDNTNSGTLNALMELNGATDALVTRLNQELIPGVTYKFSYDAGLRGSGGVAGQNCTLQLYNADTDEVEAVLSSIPLQDLPSYGATPNYITISGSYTVTRKGNYYLLFMNAGNGGTNNDYIMDRVAMVGEKTNVAICDIDGDGIPNHLDLDSDGDGCPDALEGDGGITSSQLETSSINGGNSGAEYNGIAGPVNQNLGNTIDDYGVPTIVNGGQDFGTSQDITTINQEECGTGCSQCFIAGVVGGSEACDDFDNDGILNSCDLDDDNDGILDTVEADYTETAVLNFSQLGITPPNDNNPHDYSIDISEQLGYPAGTTILSFTDIYQMNLGGDFQDDFSSSRLSPSRVTVTSLIPIKLHINSGFSIRPNAYDQLEVIDGPNLEFTSSIVNPSLTYVADEANGIYQIRNDTNDNQSNLDNGTGVFFLYENQEYTNNSTVEITTTEDFINNTYQNSSRVKIIVEYPRDTDKDGVPNHQDLDSDGDGCPDVNEAGVVRYLLSIGEEGKLASGDVVNGNNIDATANTTSTIENAKMEVSNNGDSIGPTNGFHDILEQNSAGVYDGSPYNLERYLNSEINSCIVRKIYSNPAMHSYRKNKQY